MNTLLTGILVLVMLTQVGGVANTQANLPSSTPTPVYANPATSTFEISNLQDTEVVRVVLRLEPNVKAVEAKLGDVALGERHDQALMSLFQVEMEKAGTDPKVPVLLITVKTRSLQTGSYKLRIHLRPAAVPTTQTAATTAKKTTQSKSTTEIVAEAQPLDIEIKLPAAKIKAIEKLVIHQVRNLPWTDETETLALTEVSGKRVKLTDVQISQTYATSAENQASSRIVTFKAVPEIAPNSTGKSEISISGDFPLGSTTGAALVSAPQLTEPTWISFEVQSRRARWLIVLVMVIGLSLGFVVRIWSKYRIQLQEARLKALAVAGTLRQQFDRPDQVFRARIQPRLTALESAIEQGGIELINQEITRANNELAAALNDLDIRRVQAKNQLEFLIRLSKKLPTLPPPLPTASIDAKALEEGRSALELDNVARALQVFEPLIKTAGAKLGETTPVWRSNVNSFFEQMDGLLSFLPTAVSSGIQAEKTNINQKLGSLSLTTDESTHEGILTLVRAVDEAADAFKILITRTATQLANSTDTLKVDFASLIQPAPELIDQLFQNIEGLLMRLPRWAEHPDEGARELPQALSSLKALWREALIAQLEGDEEALKKLNESLATDQFFTATLQVITFLREHQPQSDTVLGDMEAAAAAAADSSLLSAGVLSFFNLFGTRSEGDVAVLTGAHQQSLPPNLQALSTSTVRELVAAQALRLGIASLIILAIGYAVFADKFVGTFNDLLAIFVWAFGMNISVDTVMDAVKPVKF